MVLVPPHPPSADEARVLEHPEVLHDPEPRHLQLALELGERAAVTLEEPVEEQPARGIGEGSEHKGVIVRHRRTIRDRKVTCQAIASRAVPTLHLIRHGETDWNRDGRIQGHSDPPLSAAGREQAQALAERLAAEPIGALWASDLRRAVETAEPLAARLGLEIRTSPALCERDFGVNEGRVAAEVAAELGTVAGTAWHGPDDRHPQGESKREVYERVAAFLDLLLAESRAEEIALATSGGPIQMARAYLAREPVEAVVWAAVENCSVTTVEG